MDSQPHLFCRGLINQTPTAIKGGVKSGLRIYGQVARPISNAWLAPFRGLYRRPINLIVFQGPLVRLAAEGNLILWWA